MQWIVCTLFTCNLLYHLSNLDLGSVEGFIRQVLGWREYLHGVYNFALITGISPQELEDWFNGVFIDAYDWVMQTNVIGMSQFAGGGVLALKPNAASANYINKMSDY